MCSNVSSRATTFLTSPTARRTIRRAALTITGSTTDGRRNLVIAIPLPVRVVDLGRSWQAHIEAQEPLEEVRSPGKAQAERPYGHDARDRGQVQDRERRQPKEPVQERDRQDHAIERQHPERQDSRAPVPA